MNAPALYGCAIVQLDTHFVAVWAACWHGADLLTRPFGIARQSSNGALLVLVR